MERGIEVAKGRCRIGIDPFDAVALEKSVGLEVDGAEDVWQCRLPSGG